MTVTTKRRAALLSGLVVATASLAIHPFSRSFIGALAAPRARDVVAVTSEQQLRDAFNAHPDRTRVVAWLSPT